MRDHLEMLDLWFATVRAMRSQPEGLDPRILPAAERAIRLLAFTRIPEGPENAMALMAMDEGFTAYRNDDRLG